MSDTTPEQRDRDTALNRLTFLFEIAQDLILNTEAAQQYRNVAAELDGAGKLFCEEAQYDLDQTNDPNDYLYEKHGTGKVLQGAALALRAAGDQWEEPELNPVFLLIEAALCNQIRCVRNLKLES